MTASTPPPSRILLADDTPASLAILAGLFEPAGHQVFTATDGHDAVEIAGKVHPDIILLDVMMPRMNGFSACRALKENPDTATIPVIFITSRDDTESVVHGFRLGAVDYIAKPFHAEEVASRVATHLQMNRMTRELQQRNAELEREVARRHAAESARDTAHQRISTLESGEAARWGLTSFVGQSTHLRKILDGIASLQHFGSTSVLITGENGTGKELVARAIHHHSPRANGPFVPLNCVAIPAELAESLLFGHVKGAFTGATTHKKGHFELADGGTLFLDEIGDMPIALQGKLLRVLEDGQITPVGGNHARHVDVRVLCATNADLDHKIARGEFRQDLYFRLARFLVRTPPLRERKDDIPLLANHFLHYFAAEMGRATPGFSDAAIQVLCAYAFPGNVRELKNTVERALILSAGNSIQPEHLQMLHSPTMACASASGPVPPVTNADLPLNLEAAESLLIQRALEASRGNVAEAARLLGVNRSFIYRKFPKFADPSA